MEPNIYITYDMAFDDEPLGIYHYLKSVNRNQLIKFALLLIQSKGKYKSIGNYISAFFSKRNISFIESALSNIKTHINSSKAYPEMVIPHSYFIVSETTGLELLRYAFSIEAFDVPETQAIQEQHIFKAILLLNANISQFELESEYTENGDYSDLFYAKSLFCTFLNNYESVNLGPEYLAMLQVIKGYYFFKYCETSKLKEHLRIFLEQNRFSSWEQYLYNAIKLLLFPLKNEYGYTTIVLNDEGEGYPFLHSHAFSINTVVPIERNDDYTYFKAHPLIEIDDKTFIPISTIFCVNHLYRSIYFEFRSINEQLEGTKYFLKGRGLLSTITTEFSEQYLFDSFVRRVLERRHGIKLSDSDCKAIFYTGHEPDFYFRDGNNIFLFENKDIMIADKIKRSGKYEEIEKVLNRKLIDEAGICQLIHNIKNIDSGSFPWDKAIPNNPRVYPVLILDDQSLCVPGLNYILNTAFEQQLKAMNIRIKVFPLVIIELDTLIAFINDFEKGKYKLKDALDKYYIYQEMGPRKVGPEKILREVYKKYFPFYQFFSQEFVHKPFDDALFNDICDVLHEATKDYNG